MKCEDKVKQIASWNLAKNFVYSGDENASIRGIGLFIHQRWVDRVEDICSISSRVMYVTLGLNKKYRMKIIQAYAPTASSTGEEIEQFYEDISAAIAKDRTHFMFLVGDFNARMGKRMDEAEFVVGKHGYDDRNERGQMLLDFLSQKRLYATNTFFPAKRQRKWTWFSNDGVTKKEIDYIVTSDMRQVQNVSVLNSFSTGSDHRMVRAKVRINVRMERKKMTRKPIIKAASLTEQQQIEYRRILREELANIDTPNIGINDLNTKIVEGIKNGLSTNRGRPKNVNKRLSDCTIQLMEQRRQLLIEGKYGSAEHQNLNREIKKSARTDIRTFNVELAEQTIEENRGMKVLGRKMTDSKKEIFKLCDKTGVVSSNRSEILNIAREFYQELYTSAAPPPAGSDEQNRPIIRNVGSEDLPEISVEEIKAALKDLKNGKAPGEDGIPIEAIKEGGDELLTVIANMFNKCLEESRIPDSWNNAVVIVLHKKGDITKLGNYRPISLLSQLYKLFTKIITKRLTNRMDFYQPVEQAGFRSGYGTNDHLQTMRLLIEKHNEYKMNIAIAFVDYEKAFDSVELWAILNAMDECRTDSRYSDIIKYIYEHATSSIRLHEDTQKFRIGRGVRQGDTISQTLHSGFRIDFQKTGVVEVGCKHQRAISESSTICGRHCVDSSQLATNKIDVDGIARRVQKGWIKDELVENEINDEYSNRNKHRNPKRRSRTCRRIQVSRPHVTVGIRQPKERNRPQNRLNMGSVRQTKLHLPK